MRQAYLKITEALQPAHGEIQPSLFSTGFKNRSILVNEERESWPTIYSRKSSFTKPYEEIEIQNTPIPPQGQIDHGLPEFFLTIRVFKIVSLIDYIDEMLGFCYSPENLAHTCAQLPAISDMNPG